jgi:hypothetical protein
MEVINMTWQPMDTAPKTGERIFLFFPGWDYAPIASYQLFEGRNDDGTEKFTWYFRDKGFGTQGDGWLYSEDEEPTYWCRVPDNGGSL